MSDFQDFKDSIMDYANRKDWSDTVVTGFIRGAEQKLNSELRVDRMIQRARTTITCRCAPVPADWLAFMFMEVEDDKYPNGFKAIHYRPRDEFARLDDHQAASSYTIIGREVMFGGAPESTEGRDYRASYYAEVPVFSDTQDSWVYVSYQNLYRYAALIDSNLYGVGEEEKADNLKGLCEDIIQKLNAQHAYSRASGSRLTRMRVRSFG